MNSLSVVANVLRIAQVIVLDMNGGSAIGELPRAGAQVLTEAPL